MFSPNQDLIYQEFKLFIEGVQVPFVSIIVSSSMGGLPTANITVPPFPGLMDICRYYQPKVHIFYTDAALEGETLPAEKGKRECVLFIGHIAGVSFSKSRSSGYTQVTFNCNHKNALLADLLLDYTNPMDNSIIGTQPADDIAVQMNDLGSDWSIITALQGITGPPIVPSTGANANENARLAMYENRATSPTELSIEAKNSYDINATPKLANPALMNSKWQTTEYMNRYKGFPGVLMNLWNQIKRGPVTSFKDYQSMTALYIPLIEDGIKFFDRLSGHYFIENLMESGRVTPCDTNVQGMSKDGSKHLVPPCLRLFNQSSVQSQIGFQAIQQGMGFSGELTDFLSVFRKLLDTIDYELLTLTSPAESQYDPADSSNKSTQALETIIKPQLPFYFSPSCNVYYPYMYHSINVQQDEASVPTRITMTARPLPTGNNTLHLNYRTPYSVREAIASGYQDHQEEDMRTRTEQTTTADPNTSSPTPPPPPTYTAKEAAKLSEGFNLKVTTDGGINRSRVGKFEFGRGVRQRKYPLPHWLNLYPAGNLRGTEVPSTNSLDIEALNILKNAWNYRFGKEKAFLNPYDTDSGVLPHERLLFTSADYRFTMEVAASRAGSLSGVFNPYVIPGYPIDILDPEPVNPCFHAMCAGVTHNITARSVSTEVNFVAATTYTELANYYLQFVNPWLQVALKIVTGLGEPTYPDADFSDNPTGTWGAPVYPKYTNSIVMNPDAAKIADEEFYTPTLGIGSVSPDDLYDFETGTLNPIETIDSIRHGENREENPMLSAQGNLTLVWRPIETREKIETRFGLTFIDMEAHNYNPNVIKYVDQVLNDPELLEPGESQFLEYSDIPGSVPEDGYTARSTSA